MKARPVGIFIFAFLMAGLVAWLAKPHSKPELLVQGRAICDWLQDVEIGGEPHRKDPALEVLLAAGPQILPELSRVLQRFESPKDLAMRLRTKVVSIEKKYGHANESGTLLLKARAAWVMGAIIYRNAEAPEVQDATPSLVSSLRSGSPIVRYLSAQALGAMGPVASNALPALISRTTDDDCSVRMSVVEAIGRIGVDTPSAVAAITLSISDTNRDVSVTAMQALQVIQKRKPAGGPNK